MGSPEPAVDAEAATPRLGLLVYEGFNALDLVGPFEVLRRLTDTVIFIGPSCEPVASDGGLEILPTNTWADASDIDVLVVPGGPGETALVDPHPALDCIRRLSSPTTYVLGVCTGALILARASVLENGHATTHWLADRELAAHGVEFVRERYVWDGHVGTSAGVTAGIDLALSLVGLIADTRTGESIELAMEYDPAPPFGTGSPTSAPAELVAELRSTGRFIQLEDDR